MRRLYYILFYCLVFGIAWLLDPPLVVRADYLSAKGPSALRFQPVPENRPAVPLPKALAHPSRNEAEPTNMPSLFSPAWPADSEVITVKSPEPLRTGETPYRFTAIPMPVPAEMLTPQMLLPYFQPPAMTRGSNQANNLTFDPPQPDQNKLPKAAPKSP